MELMGILLLQVIGIYVAIRLIWKTRSYHTQKVIVLPLICKCASTFYAI